MLCGSIYARKTFTVTKTAKFDLNLCFQPEHVYGRYAVSAKIKISSPFVAAAQTERHSHQELIAYSTRSAYQGRPAGPVILVSRSCAPPVSVILAHHANSTRIESTGTSHATEWLGAQLDRRSQSHHSRRSAAARWRRGKPRCMGLSGFGVYFAAERKRRVLRIALSALWRGAPRPAALDSKHSRGRHRAR